MYIIYPDLRHEVFQFFNRHSKDFNNATILKKSFDYRAQFFKLKILEDFWDDWPWGICECLNPQIARWGLINIFYTPKEANLIHKFCFLIDKIEKECIVEEEDGEYYIFDSQLLKHELFPQLVDLFNTCYKELLVNNNKYEFEEKFNTDFIKKADKYIDFAINKNAEINIISDTNPMPNIWRRKDIDAQYDDIFIKT